MGNSIVGVLYIILGFIVAGTHGYFADFTTIGHILSALLAVLLWPLILIGVNLQIAI
jgi:hypothetical protein